MPSGEDLRYVLQLLFQYTFQPSCICHQVRDSALYFVNRIVCFGFLLVPSFAHHIRAERLMGLSGDWTSKLRHADKTIGSVRFNLCTQSVVHRPYLLHLFKYIQPMICIGEVPFSLLDVLSDLCPFVLEEFQAERKATSANGRQEASDACVDRAKSCDLKNVKFGLLSAEMMHTALLLAEAAPSAVRAAATMIWRP